MAHRRSRKFRGSELFSPGQKLFIGVVHLRPLPGSPRWNGSLDEVIESAVQDALAYQRGGARAVFIENFNDVPFTKGPVAPETLAAMAVAGRAVHDAFKLPIGFNVLRNDARGALALCAACGGSFVRINVHTGAMLTDQGVIEGQAYETLRYRRSICPAALIFADVHVKHAVPLGPTTVENAARDTLERGLADALIVSGTGTGVATDLADLERVRKACPSARILLGSGVTEGNAASYIAAADGFIVGSSLKLGGKVGNPVDPVRVARLAKVLHRGQGVGNTNTDGQKRNQ
jgi:uncharacterized protein